MRILLALDGLRNVESSLRLLVSKETGSDEVKIPQRVLLVCQCFVLQHLAADIVTLALLGTESSSA